jgi:TfoX/Sxy family transcriptional regulator of competence genes
MEIPKPTEDDKEFFRSLLPAGGGVEVKPMFGNIAAFVNGNMFAGLFGSTVGVRLGEADLAALRALPGVTAFGPAERPMGGYAGLPAAWRHDPGAAEPWVARALAHVATMKPKAKKAAKRTR